MWLLVKGIVLRFIVGRTVGGMLAALLVLLAPLAGVLKLIGLPILLVLGVIGAPVMAVLAAIGLPLLFVLGIGGALIVAVGLLLALGVMAIKVVLPIVLIVWFVRWAWRAMRSDHTTPGVGPVTGAPD